MKKYIIAALITVFAPLAILNAASTIKLIIRGENANVIMDVKDEGDGRTSVNLYTSEEEKRIALNLRTKKEGEDLRMASFQCHGEQDAKDDRHNHCSMYTYTALKGKRGKIFQWDWGVEELSLEVMGNIFPSNNYHQRYDLGTSKDPWQTVYADKLILDGEVFTGEGGTTTTIVERGDGLSEEEIRQIVDEVVTAKLQQVFSCL